MQSVYAVHKMYYMTKRCMVTTFKFELIVCYMKCEWNGMYWISWKLYLISSIALYLKFIWLDHKDLSIKPELTNQRMFLTPKTWNNYFDKRLTIFFREYVWWYYFIKQKVNLTILSLCLCTEFTKRMKSFR